MTKSSKKTLSITKGQEGEKYPTVTRRKVDWIGHILCRNCLLKHVVEGKIEVIGRGVRRRKQILGDLKENRGYWKLQEEPIDLTMRRTRFAKRRLICRESDKI